MLCCYYSFMPKVCITLLQHMRTHTRNVLIANCMARLVESFWKMGFLEKPEIRAKWVVENPRDLASNLHGCSHMVVRITVRDSI